MYSYASFTPQQPNQSPMLQQGVPQGVPSPMQNPPMQRFAHGGRVKTSQFKPAHMSKRELNFLDHLQGRVERTKHGVRTYPHIEELLSNPHLHAKIHEHIQHHASGGMAEGDMNDHMSHEGIQHMIHNGRNGDNDVALLGPRTHHLFHQMAGHSTINPDGHPEYWSLGSILGGMKGALGSGLGALKKGAASAAGAIGRGASAAGRGLVSAGKAAMPHIGAIGQAALPAVSNIAAQHLGRLTGNEDVGNMLSGLGSAAAGAAFNKMAGPGEANPLATAVGQGLGQFATAKNEGRSTRSAIGEGLSHIGNQAGDSTSGNILGAVGHGLQNGSSGSDIGRAIMPHALSGGIGALAAAANQPGGFKERFNAAADTLSPVNAIRHESQQRHALMQELPFSGEDSIGY